MILFKLNILIIVLLNIYQSECVRLFSRGRLRGGNLGKPDHGVEPGPLPPDEWFLQPLDHFNPQNNQTWKQRFFRNATFFKEGGPVFLMIGGEGEASAEWMVKGAWIEYAKTHRALCFQLEHRFYGKSHPTSDLSVKSLEFLSSMQALADLAAFIESMDRTVPAGTRWVVFGGSYPGSLAAWARARYPHLIHAAVSASGPLLALADFEDYYKVVEESLNTTGNACTEAVAAAQYQLSLMLSHRVGQQSASKILQLCQPIDPKKPEDIENLYETLASVFAGIVQYNHDNRKGSNLTIEMACSLMTDTSQGVAVKRLAALSNMVLDMNNQTCLDYTYESTVNSLKNESWDSETAEGGRQWMYQTCTEFGFFQTSTRAETQRLFGQFPLSLFERQCTDVFGEGFTPSLLEHGVDRTNTEYGELRYEADRVVFVHGSIDPWHALGITKTIGPNTLAIYIKDTAHCANMYPSSNKDLPQLVDARKAISKLLRKWILE